MSARFTARIMRHRVEHFLGTWSTRDECLLARDRAALHFGETDVSAEARALGPASPAELRTLARQSHKLATRTSAFVGVSYDKRRARWLATVYVGDERHLLGYFREEIEAAIAVDRASLHFGLDHRNVPSRKLSPASPEQIKREEHAKRKASKTSRYHGVYLRAGEQRPWFIAVIADGRNQSVGGFERERDAALARDRLALMYQDNPVLNFPARARALGPAALDEIRRASSQERKRRTASQYVGVTVARNGQFVAAIRHKGKKHHLGLFDDERAAAEAFDAAARRLRGRDAVVNFPTAARSTDSRT
jgi:hypothetical protein